MWGKTQDIMTSVAKLPLMKGQYEIGFFNMCATRITLTLHNHILYIYIYVQIYMHIIQIIYMKMTHTHTCIQIQIHAHLNWIHPTTVSPVSLTQGLGACSARVSVKPLSDLLHESGAESFMWSLNEATERCRQLLLTGLLDVLSVFTFRAPQWAAVTDDV